MYCIRCGVQLVEGQTRCPLCATEMVLPEDLRRDATLYPADKHPKAGDRLQLHQQQPGGIYRHARPQKPALFGDHET